MKAHKQAGPLEASMSGPPELMADGWMATGQMMNSQPSRPGKDTPLVALKSHGPPPPTGWGKASLQTKTTDRKR